MSDENDSIVNANRTKVGAWEKFDLTYYKDVFGYSGYTIIRAGETTNTGSNYLFANSGYNIYFGLRFEREDALWKIEDL